MKSTKNSFTQEVFRYLQMLLGVFIAVYSMKAFMIPNHFMDGGITGISILVHEISHINISILVIVFNLFFVYLASKWINKQFAYTSLFLIICLAIGLYFFDFSPVTHDRFLIAIFGGVLMGVATGIIMRANAMLDGFEILAIKTKRRFGLTIYEIILASNSILFLTAALYLGIEIALYSIITYFCASKVAEYITDGLEEFISLTIISSKSDEIKSLIVNDYKKGISVYKGERGFLPHQYEIHQDCDVIVTVITRFELVRIKEAVYELDENAFMYVTTVKEARGGILKEKHSH